MSRNSRSTALKAVAALVLVTTLAACSDVPLTQPSDLAPQAAQHDASITSTLVCANSTNTTYNGVAAFDIAPNVAYGSLGGSATWIGPFANSGQTDVPVGHYVFTTTFTATEGDAVSGSILADNGATITIGGTTLPTIGATATTQAVVATFQTATGFTGILAGQNSITVDLYNSGFTPTDLRDNPTGASYCFTVKSCPAAPAIANAYLKEHGISVSGAKGKLILSSVAKHMLPGATFDGLGKCDDGYAAAVILYITPLL
jgi:hypothetical protein